MARQQRLYVIVSENHEGTTTIDRVKAESEHAARQAVKEFYAKVYDFAPQWQVARIVDSIQEATLKIRVIS